MLAECQRDGGKIVAGRAVFEHVAARAEARLRDRAKVPELRAVLARPLGGGDQVVLRKPGAALVVGAAPAVAPIAADDGGGEAGFDRHDGKYDRQDLAGAAVAEAGAGAPGAPRPRGP